LLWLLVANNVSLSADVAPIITSQPQPQTALEGVNLALRVAAVSSTPIRYRWRFYGTNLPNDFPGQFTPLLSLRNVTPAVSGPYSVIVSNNYGAVTSTIAQVTVSNPDYAGGGYVLLKPPPGYSILTAQMSSSGSSQTVSNQLQFVPDGVSVFKMDGNGFTANNRLDGWSLPEQVLAFGEGWFVYNPTAEPVFVVFAGTVLGGHMVDKLPAGYSVCADMVPQAGPLMLLNFPRTPGTTVYRFDNVSETYSVYMAGEEEWVPSEPSVGIGEAFWVKESYPVEWAQDFTLNLGLAAPSYVLVQPTLTSEVGEINFFTYHTNGLFGRVLDLDGQTPLNSGYMGQLWAGTNGSESALVPIGNPLPFLDGFGAGYIRGGSLKLPGLRGGDTVYLQLRVWEQCAGDTYDRAVANGSATGRSTIFSAVAHATIENGGPGLPPRNANMFPTFAVSLGQAVLQIARVQPAANGQTEICFATQPGSVYCLQRAVSLQAPVAWEPVLGANEIIGTGHMVKLLDATATQAFYRVCKVR
jgi:hypothetical protein